MTLRGDKPTRPPMKPTTLRIVIGVAVGVLVFVGIVLAVSGQSFF